MLQVITVPARNHTAHLEAFARRVKRDAIAVSVSESDGSDGHSTGTWLYQVSRGGWETPVSSTVDGGYSSREHATEEAARVARRWAAEAPVEAPRK